MNIRIRSRPRRLPLVGLALGAALWTAATDSVMAQTATTPLFAWQEALYGDTDNKLRWPVAVASAADDELAVADAFGSRLFLFKDQGGTVGWRLQTTAELPGSPTALTSNGTRYLVALRGSDSLTAVDRTQFRFRSLALPTKTVPGPLATTAEGGILVYDLAAGQVLELTSDGELTGTIDVDGHVTSLASGSGGDFLVSTVDPGEIRRYSLQGELLDSWTVPGSDVGPAWPIGVARRSGGEMIVLDRKGHRLLVLKSGGQLAGTGSRWGWESGLLLRPSSLSIFSDGRIAVADQGNGRIQIFQPVRQDSQ